MLVCRYTHNFLMLWCPSICTTQKSCTTNIFVIDLPGVIRETRSSLDLSGLLRA